MERVFIVRVAGAITGLGTGVGGYVVNGDVRAGDELVWHVDDEHLSAICCRSARACASRSAPRPMKSPAADRTVARACTPWMLDHRGDLREALT